MQGSIILKMMYTFINFDVDIYTFSPMMPLCITVLTLFPKIQ